MGWTTKGVSPPKMQQVKANTHAGKVTIMMNWDQAGPRMWRTWFHDSFRNRLLATTHFSCWGRLVRRRHRLPGRTQAHCERRTVGTREHKTIGASVTKSKVGQHLYICPFVTFVCAYSKGISVYYFLRQPDDSRVVKRVDFPHLVWMCVDSSPV